MRLSRITAPAVLAALALALVTACGGGPGSGGDRAEDAPSPVPSVSFAAPKQAAAPAAYRKLAKGEVHLEQGPFTDRVKVTGGALAAASTVTGHLAATSDVSELIALELSAAYYDADGKLLGTGSFRYAEEGHDDHKGAHTPAAEGPGIDFKVQPEAPLSGTPASAVLSIPVLVNE
ncbi:hypothetical protein [Streptomyces violascens]|uniref:Lipoprotein n=1 Tax=Streptomyces violascens TaxID=67381 RepID=A0ABQ3QEE4_9ACTN|nr:hypothetical protein [Streptomyces violascens]GGU00974.1 hypothetical protein GCM10010289_22300 [Streptomyces violascens]GHI35642.1 hypothetical protein Sviol_00500 [Streptomyces violascens]